MTDNKVAIVILNWNGFEDTIACLESLLQLETGGIGIFVCDNASTDGSIAKIRQWSASGLAAGNARRADEGRPVFRFRDLADRPWTGEDALPFPDGGPDVITLIDTGRNGGFAMGNNVGLRHALAEGFDYFWLLNNDTEVEPDAVTWQLRRMQEDSSIGMCGATLVYSGQRDLVQHWAGSSFNVLKGRGDALGAHHKRTEPIDRDAVEQALGYVSGAAMFVSRAFLDQVGLMAEDYFLYWEELDWAARAKGRFRLGYAPETIVYHKVGASIGTNDFGARSPLSDFYMARNRVRCCWRHSRISLPFACADILRQALRWALRADWRRAVLLMRAMLQMPYVSPR